MRLKLLLIGLHVKEGDLEMILRENFQEIDRIDIKWIM